LLDCDGVDDMEEWTIRWIRQLVKWFKLDQG